MYKLILVDDEEEERKGILNKIEWNKYGFEIAGEAENGMEALEIAEKTIPDVMITDIKMPFMDGLTLSEKIMDKYPNTKIIILTGFDQFEYAQKAIKLDVIEYVLKPISSKELIDVIIRIKKKIDDEIAQRKDIEILREYYYKSLPILREKFLCSLITNKLNETEISEKLKIYGINLYGKGFIAAVIDIDFGKNVNLDDISDKDHKNEKFDDWGLSKNIELIRLGVLNLCQEIIKKYILGTAFLNDDYIVIIFSSDDDEPDAFMERIFPILDEINQSINKYYGTASTVGIGSFCNKLNSISYSYESAVSALGYSLILGSNRLICIEDIEPKNTKRVTFDELKERSLLNSLKVGTKNEMVKTIDELFKEIIDVNISFRNYQIYLMEILTSILKAVQDLNIDLDEVLKDDNNMLIEILKLKDIKEVRDWIIRICLKIKSNILIERQNSYKQIVQAAIQYLNENYDDSSITIEKVCKMLHISPAYFSTIFKKETKLTFVNYLTQIRMEAAKKLLRTTNFKTFEIAKMVGYAEPNYFSYCFKKNFNISPSEYRNSL